MTIHKMIDCMTRSADVPEPAGVALRISRLPARVGRLAVPLVFALCATPALAGPAGSGNHAQPPSGNLAGLKAIGITIVLITILLLKKYKKNSSARGRYKNSRRHDEQVEMLVKLKKTYMQQFRQVYPDGYPDDVLTIECPSCKKNNLLYASHCRYCDELISLEPIIKSYEDKIRELASHISASRSSAHC